MKKSILKQVENHTLTPSQALDRLYGPKVKRANFVKVSINIRESVGVTALLSILLFFPIPIWFGKYFIKKAMRSQELPEDIYEQIVTTCGGTTIHVVNEDVTIHLYIF